ncbi:MAG: hypothetical protein KGL43_19970 [Burkholderiales bacterium]|nr:hypothetical protein [Burkholderiales bacterium]
MDKPTSEKPGGGPASTFANSEEPRKQPADILSDDGTDSKREARIALAVAALQRIGCITRRTLDGYWLVSFGGITRRFNDADGLLELAGKAGCK